MALNATMYRFGIQISDLDRGYYDQVSLHVAQHPSETLERVTVRLFAWCLHADPQLAFSRGLSTEDEPDLWQHNYSGEIELWIEVGLPDIKRLRKAAGRAKAVVVYAYGGQAMQHWLQHNHRDLLKIDNIEIRHLDQNVVDAFANTIQRTMEISCMIQDSVMILNIGDQMYELAVQRLYPETDLGGKGA
jgi:uncharacterized protein YaeQ